MERPSRPTNQREPTSRARLEAIARELLASVRGGDGDVVETEPRDGETPAGCPITCEHISPCHTTER
jgi:hypothetical protein